MSKRVYICGPISRGDLLHNIRQADEAFLALAKLGFAPFNPMLSCFAGSVRERTGSFQWSNLITESSNGTTHTGADVQWVPYIVPSIEAIASRGSALDLSHADWIRIDLAYVEVAHALLRLPGESVGAELEVAHAIKHGVPVFHSIPELVQRFHWQSVTRGVQ